MTDDFERRIRRDLDAIGAAVPIGDGVVEDAARSERRARLRSVGVAAALVLIGGLAAIGFAWGSGGDGPDSLEPPSTSQAQASSTTTTEAAGEDPPPSGTGRHSLWMSASVVTTGGTDVVFAVVGPTADVDYGVGTLLDRWTGAEWEPIRFAASCVDHWHCWGELRDLDDTRVRSIGLDLADTGVGTAEYVRIGGLDEGWYRLRKVLSGAGGEEVATAVFRSSDAVSATMGAPAPAVEGERLRVSPVVTSDRGSRVTVSTLVSETNVLPAKLALHHYTDRSWQFVAVFDTFSFSNRAGSTIELLLPALASGAYRLTNAEGVVEHPIGRFWVGDEPLNSTPCHAFSDLADLLGADADGYGEASPPGEPQRASTTPGGFRVEWDGPTSAIVYSYPSGGVIDLVGERVNNDGPLLVRSGTDTDGLVEVWVRLDPNCPGRPERGSTAAFIVTSESEVESFVLAKRLGDALAERWGDDSGPRNWDDCPGGSSATESPRNGVILDVWMYCQEVGDSLARLVPVPTNIISDRPIVDTILRGLGDPWNGLTSAIPLELRWADTELDITDDLLSIDWGWDFAANPIDNLSTSGAAGRMVAQIAANAFQFDEIEAIDLSSLPGEHDGEFIYTREQWEQAQADE